ncbi:MAG TPA: CHC2 zinc finger domain-containing protein [Candidatus Paceibacterota bacterium]|nr:CHC2 zinc finger domain-containing protein [Candidatus Paceibacterota bacterium]
MVNIKENNQKETKLEKVEKQKQIKKEQYTRKIWDQIKEKVKIPDLVQLKNNRCECLQFGNTTTPSCQYYEDSETLHCHKCKKTMDVIEVYAVLNNIERSEAIKKLAKQYNIPFGNVDQKQIEIEKKV